MTDMTSPTFVCQFSDGIVTRMTTYCTPDNLDLKRGIALARIAYGSRKKGKKPPLMAKAHFENRDGKILQQCDVVTWQAAESALGAA